MGKSELRRCGTGLAAMLVAGSVEAAEINSSPAPLIASTIGSCSLIQNPATQWASAENGNSPIGTVNNYFFLKEKREVGLTGKVQLVEAPAHGSLQRIPDYPEEWAFRYLPQADYEGPDRATFLVEIAGQKVKLVYFFKVMNGVPGGTDGYDPYRDKKLCPKGAYWKISSTFDADGNATLTTIDYQGSAADSGSTPLSSWLAAAKLDAFVADASNVSVTFADLASAALGSSSGNSITLDTNAAGYNWFIDSTPSDNSEFLPTANPNEWIAKADSAAAGKMDMLSVLLHEYGHALGIEHSASAHDYMATTLAPGVRRLPSTDELALMDKLAGDLRLELAGESTPSPDTPSSPLPSVPLGGSLGLALLGRLRGNRYGGWNIAVDSASLIPQYAVAANPKLSNTEFVGGQGWSTTGDVRFQDGAATLTETAPSQTRLNQVFIIGENDRFLSFTVADTALDDADQAPDDAFEVALLDANTGASLLGGTGLTRNDAFLNLQADGNEHKSQAVTSIRNADGSRTYLIDLAGIPAGTAVNLAFDLIGFGKGAAAASSHLTIRDLRIGVPQTKDDSATLAEDGVTTIAALANDLNAQQPGFAPIIVDAPVHGQITINADGTFSFAPEKDWHGEDHFSYKLSDGHVDSNLAIVSLTVTPVNDAPVAAHDAANVGEDGSVVSTGNLLANDRTWAGAGGQRAPAGLESRRRETSCQGLSAGVVRRRCQPYRHRLV